MSYPALIKGGSGPPSAAPSDPRGGPPPLAQRRHPPTNTLHRAGWSRANKTGREMGGGGRAKPAAPPAARRPPPPAHPDPPLQTRPWDVCARCRGRLAARHPSPPHPPAPATTALLSDGAAGACRPRPPRRLLACAVGSRRVVGALPPSLSPRAGARSISPSAARACLFARARRRAVVVARGGGCSSGFLPLFGLLLLWAVAACTRSHTVAPAPVCDVTVLYRCAR